MKWICSLSGAALVSFLTANLGITVASATEQASNSISSAQVESVLIAGFFDGIQRAVQTIQQVDQVVDSVNSLVEQENRRRELEAAREAASEQERLEAERRQQYFESLSPEEQQAYIAEQQAMQARRDQAATLFILGLGAMMFGSSSGDSGAEGSASDICYVYNSDGTVAYSARRDQISDFSGVEC